MTNAKYSPRNYIIVKRGSIAHVLYLIHAKGMFLSSSRERTTLRFMYKPMIRPSSHFAVYCQKQGCFLVFRKLYYSGHDRLMAIFES